MKTRLAVAMLLLALAVPADANAAHYVIEIKHMAFGPAPTHLKVGDTIEWKNLDIFRHSATARTGEFNVDLLPGAKAEVTLKKPGTINVFCRYHPTMKLRLDVASP